MAYCNINQYIAKKLAKTRNIVNCEQVEKNFKSSAYLAWNNMDDTGFTGRAPQLLTYRSTGDRKRNKRNPLKDRSISTSDSGQRLSDNDLNATVVPNLGYTNSKDSTAIPSGSNSNIIKDTPEVFSDISINIEEIFPAPGVIIKDLFDLYNSNKPINEKESALLNYVKLLFSRSM